jgi:hypothetical protein
MEDNTPEGRPERLVISDGGVWESGRNAALGGLAFLGCVLGLALKTTEATPADLKLPAGALGGFWLLWVGLHAVASLVNRIRDRRAIRRFFGGEIWACWRHSRTGWRELVEAEALASAPPGLAPFAGAIYSSALGAVFAAAILVMARFAAQRPEHQELMNLSAAGVFLLLLGIGLFQPIAARLRAAAYRRRALRVSEPRVWFGPGGVYEESFGFTPLDPLEGVSDNTRARGVITFTVSSVMLHKSGELYSRVSYPVPVPIAVPAEHRHEAARLVRRYRALTSA